LQLTFVPKKALIIIQKRNERAGEFFVCWSNQKSSFQGKNGLKGKLAAKLPSIQPANLFYFGLGRIHFFQVAKTTLFGLKILYFEILI
jgi:hypothetical protein